MQARITRRLDPAYRQTAAYTHAPQDNKHRLERAAEREQVLPPFSDIGVKMRVEREDRPHENVLMGRLGFVREDGRREYAELWTRCPLTVVAELREKLRTVFGVELPEVDVWPWIC